MASARLKTKNYPGPAIDSGKAIREACKAMNIFGKSRTPFFFLIDFLLRYPRVIPLSLLDQDQICFSINGFEPYKLLPVMPVRPFRFVKHPPLPATYKAAFTTAMINLEYGNTYLINLTLPTEIETDLTLKEIYQRSNAPYKLWFRDQFVVFSPERFVRIKDNIIEAHPMKGTIDAGIEGAREKLLADEKETAEHNTIVDLIRNDLNRIASDVRVEKFRYVTEIQTHEKKLLQVSSKITGRLPENFHRNIGDIIISLLPAGSISGAPKKKTIDVILEAEQYERGYYTGIMGYFDSRNLDSGVLIRYIEKKGEKLWFKSGGGITINSRWQDEYDELVNKVYVPFD